MLFGSNIEPFQLDQLRAATNFGSQSTDSAAVGTPDARRARDADVVILAGWEAIETADVSSLARSTIVACVLDWPWARRGLNVASGGFPAPGEVAALLKPADVVVAISEGMRSALATISQREVLWWPLSPVDPHTMSAPGEIWLIPQAVSHDEAAELATWLRRVATSGVEDASIRVVMSDPQMLGAHAEQAMRENGVLIEDSIPQGTAAFGVLPGSLLFAAHRRASVANNGFLPAYAWMTDLPVLVDGVSGRFVRLDSATNASAAHGESCDAVTQLGAKSSAVWRQIGTTAATWVSAEPSENNLDPASTSSLVVALRAAALAPADIGARLGLAAELYDCGFDNFAALNLRMAGDLRSLGLDLPAVSGRLRDRLIGRRISSDEHAAPSVVDLVSSTTVDEEATPIGEHTGPFGIDAMLGVRYYDWAPELRVVRRSATALLPEKHAGVAWWLASGSFSKPEQTIASLSVSSDGAAISHCGNYEDGKWSVVFASPTDGPFPRPATILFDIVGSAGPSVSDGAVTFETLRGLSQRELGSNFGDSSLLAPLTVGASPEAAGMYPDSDGAWVGQRFSLMGPFPDLGSTGPLLVELQFDSNHGAQFDWLEITIGDKTINAFRTDTDTGVARFRGDMGSALAAFRDQLEADQPSTLTIGVFGHTGPLPAGASAAPFRFLAGGIHVPLLTNAAAGQMRLVDEVALGDGFVTLERYNDTPVTWLTGPGTMTLPGEAIIPAGASVVAEGPLHLGRECLDATEVHLNGLPVDPVAIIDRKKGWRWVGRLRTESDVFAPHLSLKFRCDIAHQLSDNDTRRASLLVSKIGVAVAPDAALFDGADFALPHLMGAPYAEPFGKGIDGVWMTRSASMWLDLAPSTTEVVVKGDIATSRDVLEAVSVALGDDPVERTVVANSDGSWSVIVDVSDAAQADYRTSKLKLEVPGRDVEALSLLVSSVETR